MRSSVLFLAGLLAGGAQAQSFTFKDWAVACDNTRHCEATGFQAEGADEPVQLWLARDAGPGTPVRARLAAASGAGPLRLRLRGFSTGPTGADDALPAADVAAFLARAADASEAEVSDGKQRFVLSLAGLKAALLKMDEAQGRLGSVDALVRKGTRPATQALPPLPVPALPRAALPPPRPADAALAAAVLRAVQPRDCWAELPDAEGPATAVLRVSATQLVVMRECLRGAYQGSSALWLAADKPPHAPRRLRLPMPGQAQGSEDDMATMATLEGGELSSWAKARGVGDCGESARWAWNGQGFALLEAAEAPLCRGFAGGGFALRTWVSRRAP